MYNKRLNLTTPFLEIGIKNYLYGDKVLDLAMAADKYSKQYDVDVILVTPYTEIRRVVERTERLIIFAPYMDIIRPGRGMADILPEALKDAGVSGVVINHIEKPTSLSGIRRTIERANELDLLTFVCVDTVSEAKAVAHFDPDIINPEPSELIGTNRGYDVVFAKEAIEAVKCINPDIIVEIAAGIVTGQQVYDTILLGAEAVGVASGICKADNPVQKAEEMIKAIFDAKRFLRLI